MIAGHVPDKEKGEPDWPPPRDPAWPSIERLAELTGKSASNVRRSIDYLEAHGELTVERRARGRGNQYRLRWHDPAPANRLPMGGNELSTHEANRLPIGGSNRLPAHSQPPTGRRLREGREAEENSRAGASPTELFEALAEVCGFDVGALTRTERGRLNMALAELRERSATPADVRARGEEYRRKWPRVDLTPQAIVGNWSKLAPRGVTNPRRPDYGTTYR